MENVLEKVVEIMDEIDPLCSREVDKELLSDIAYLLTGEKTENSLQR